MIQDVLYMTEGMGFRTRGSTLGSNFINNCEYRYSGRKVQREDRSEGTRSLGKRLQIQSSLLAPYADTLIAAHDTAVPYAVASELEAAPGGTIHQIEYIWNPFITRHEGRKCHVHIAFTIAVW